MGLMGTLMQDPKIARQPASATSPTPGRTQVGYGGAANSGHHLQRTIGNQALQRLLGSRAAASGGGQVGTDPDIEIDGAGPVGQAEVPVGAFGALRPGDTRAVPHDFIARAPHGPWWDVDRISLSAPGRTRRPPPSAPRASAPLPGAVQAKLVVGQANDPLEHEADRIAEQVMRMPAPPPTASGAALQRKCACQETASEEGERSETLRAKPRLQRTGESRNGNPVVVHEVLRSAGEPLDAPARAFFEPRFGRDFSQVRAHADDRAARSAQSIGALAYTVGPHIVFVQGQYPPGADRGRHLLAHELAHTIQQGHTRIKRPLSAMQQFGKQVLRTPDPAAAPPVLRRTCAACAEEAQHEDETEQTAQLARKESGGPSTTLAIPSIVEDVIRSPGVPLDSASRALMEPRFGRSFGDVRIHADSQAAESARRVNALAYTVGSHIVFGPNQSPREHPQLLAHELVHVQRQRAAAGAIPQEIGEPSAPEEVEADRIADSIMNGSAADEPLQAASPRLSRWVSCASTPFTGMELQPACPPREPGEITRSQSGLSVGSISDPETGEIVFGFAVGSSNASGLASDPTWRTFSSSIASSSTDRWEILGFTDCEGPESLNADLRQERANKVSAQLPPAAKAQIDNTVGAPMTDCVASNDTESNRRFNRSVVFRRTSSTLTFPAESITGIQCPPTAAITATNLADYIALMQCAEARMGLSPREMLTVLRQIYYGKPWSNAKTSLWDRVIQCSAAVGDPGTQLGAPLFESLKKSQEVAGVDVGHVFAGLEAMTCPTAEVSFPVAGGLIDVVAAMPNEAFATWGGDLGAAAAAHVACDQLGSAAASKDDCGMKPPPQTLRFYFDHHAPPQDLEGDIDPFILRASEKGITCASSPGATFAPSRAISEIFADAYINSTSKLGVLHQNRYECMLQLLGATISGKRVANRAAIKSKFMSQVASFADLFFTKIKGGGITDVSDVGDRTRMRANSFDVLDMFIDYLESKL